MTFYIDNFMPGTADSPSIARIILPDTSSFSALVSSDISVQLANKFGNLLPGVEMLSDIAQLVGAVNIPAWIGASVQGWRGTDPIKLSLELFLVNYKPNLNYEESIRKLTKLCTVSRSDRDGVSGHWTQQVHGGYSTKASAFASKTQFLDRKESDYWTKKDDWNNPQQNVENLTQFGNAIWNGAGGNASFPGTLTISIGNRFELRELLLTSITVTNSNVEVYSPSAGDKPKPLYYKLSISVMTCRTALETDVDIMFK